MDTIFVYMNLIMSPSPPSVQYHVDHNRVHFYVDDSSAANALHKCSHKITDTDGYKVRWGNNGNLTLIAAEILLNLLSLMITFFFFVSSYIHCIIIFFVCIIIIF